MLRYRLHQSIAPVRLPDTPTHERETPCRKHAAIQVSSDGQAQEIARVAAFSCNTFIKIKIDLRTENTDCQIRMCYLPGWVRLRDV